MAPSRPARWRLSAPSAEIVLGSERADLEQRKILAETVLAAKQAHFSKNNLDKVKVGDMVDITWTSAALIAFEE